MLNTQKKIEYRPKIDGLRALAHLSHHGRTLISNGHIPLYRDEDRLSIAGSIRLRPLFEPIFKEISKP